MSAGRLERPSGPLAAMALTGVGLGLCCAAAIVSTTSANLSKPLTFALAACALYAAISYVDFEGTIFIDASSVPLLLAAVFLGSAPAFAVVVLAEFAVWLRQRYRIKAALINVVATGIPTVLAAEAFSALQPQGLTFYAAIAIVGVAALVLNLALLVGLLRLLDGSPLFTAPSHLWKIFPAFALNVLLAIAAANVYVNVGLVAAIFVLVVVFAFQYLITHLFLARQRAQEIESLAESRGRLAAQALETEERERRALAAALHDGPVQDLMAARQDVADAAEGDSEGLGRTRAAIDRTVWQLREVVFDLYPPALDRFGLGAALSTLAKQQEKRGSLAISLHVESDIAQSERLIYSVARELLTNAAKHANAKHVSVKVEMTGCQIAVVVSDDGGGFTDEDRARAFAQGHVGLASLQERIEAMGGNFEIESAPGRGTCVTVRLPKLHRGDRPSSRRSPESAALPTGKSSRPL